MSRLLVLMMSLVAVLTALISVNGAVAALLPVVVVMAIRLGRAPSQLLMPLVFSAHCGSLLALTGTPVNVLVSEAATEAGLPPFGFFSFAIAGIPLVAGTIADRSVVRAAVAAGHEVDDPCRPILAGTLVRWWSNIGWMTACSNSVCVPRSPYVGFASGGVDLADYPGLTLVAIQAGDGTGRVRRPALADGDVLIVRGDAETAASLASDKLLAFRAGRCTHGYRGHAVQS